MDFNKEKPIFIQIAEAIEDKILQNEWNHEERIPSVRDTAVLFKVNPNTVMRSYNLLQENNLIDNKRGIGYFLMPDARQNLINLRKKSFLENAIPELIKSLKQLDISVSELITNLKNYENQ